MINYSCENHITHKWARGDKFNWNSFKDLRWQEAWKNMENISITWMTRPEWRLCMMMEERKLSDILISSFFSRLLYSCQELYFNHTDELWFTMQHDTVDQLDPGEALVLKLETESSTSSMVKKKGLQYTIKLQIIQGANGLPSIEVECCCLLYESY